MLNFFGGVVLMALGALVVIKSEAVYNFFGPMEFFEKYLGTEGGSRLGWKLVGFIVFFFGMLMATGLIGDFLNWVLTPLIRASTMKS